MLNFQGPARLISFLPLFSCILLSSVVSAKCHEAEGLPSHYRRAREKHSAMDQLVRHSKVAKIFPYKTHLPILAQLVQPHLDFVRGYIPTEGPLAAEFKALEAEALKAKKKENVTYSWWIRFNAKLARVLTAPDKRTPINEAVLQSLIDQFPLISLFPWVEGSEVSLISEVQSFSIRSESLPLISGPVQRNGKEVQPDALFAEALKHAQVQLKAHHRWVDGKQLQAFHRFFMEELETRSAQERDRALWVYWLATRVHTMDAQGLLEAEAGPMVKRIFEDNREQLIVDLMDAQQYRWLLPNSIDPDFFPSVKMYAHESIRLFELIASIANSQR